MKQRESNKPQIKAKTKLDTLLNKYKQRFTGIGKAMLNSEEIQIAIPMKDEATPIARKPR